MADAAERDCAELLQRWLGKAADPDVHAELVALDEAGDAVRVQDAFYRDLAFGTAGLRGIIGAGTNRMNVYTVARATQGFADYLNARCERPVVAIARDSRNKGWEFVRCAASVFAANGVRALVFPRIEPVPSLSFAMRDLSCSGGVCVTASHNPAAYNGYKVYGSDGCQIAADAAREISNLIERVDVFSGVRSMDFDQAVNEGLVSWIDDAVLDRYLDAVQALSVEPAACCASDPLHVVYTPLNGAGAECVGRILARIGVDVTVVPEQAEPDGDFPTCPYPNPEERAALECGIELCRSVRPDLLLATDPDADRVGVAVEDGGEYIQLSGNEIGVLLLDYLAGRLAAQGADLARRVAVTTIVSSVMVDALARAYGFSVRRVLTGFKYIGGVVGELEAVGEADRFIFGFEESYGYLSGTHVRDKDGVNASMLICQMARHHKARGLSLVEAMRALYERYGFFYNKTLSFSYPGARGAERMRAIMESLRRFQAPTLAGLAVDGLVDYAAGICGLPPADVVEFNLAGGNKLVVRPSGTEPKVKAYLFGKGETALDADAVISALEREAERLLS